MEAEANKEKKRKRKNGAENQLSSRTVSGSQILHPTGDPIATIAAGIVLSRQMTQLMIRQSKGEKTCIESWSKASPEPTYL